MARLVKIGLAVFYWLPAIPFLLLLGIWWGIIDGGKRFIEIIKKDVENEDYTV